jgi:hypothetical protein
MSGFFYTHFDLMHISGAAQRTVATVNQLPEKETPRGGYRKWYSAVIIL